MKILFPTFSILLLFFASITQVSAQKYWLVSKKESKNQATYGLKIGESNYQINMQDKGARVSVKITQTSTGMEIGAASVGQGKNGKPRINLTKAHKNTLSLWEFSLSHTNFSGEGVGLLADNEVDCKRSCARILYTNSELVKVFQTSSATGDDDDDDSGTTTGGYGENPPMMTSQTEYATGQFMEYLDCIKDCQTKRRRKGKRK